MDRPNMRKIATGCTFHNHLKVGYVRCARCIHIALDPQWGLFQQDHAKTLLTTLMPLSKTKVVTRWLTHGELLKEYWRQ